MRSQAGSECPALVIDYSNQRCYRLDRNTQGRSRDLQPREDYNYFEKICLGREYTGFGPLRGCVSTILPFPAGK